MENMIPDPDAYFMEFVPTREALLLTLEEEARNQDIPIVGPVVGELLFILAYATQARQIIELGTASGYSAIYLAKACERTTPGHYFTVSGFSEPADFWLPTMWLFRTQTRLIGQYLIILHGRLYTSFLSFPCIRQKGMPYA